MTVTCTAFSIQNILEFASRLTSLAVFIDSRCWFLLPLETDLLSELIITLGLETDKDE
jgi:hypothetical protein